VKKPTNATVIHSGEKYPTNAQGCCKLFLLCLLDYPAMFRLPNAIFRALHFPFHKLLYFSAFRVGVGYCTSGAAICCGMSQTNRISYEKEV
jgi:hypothetical protein